MAELRSDENIGILWFLINLMLRIQQGTWSVGLIISRYLGRLRSLKIMITREVNYELGVILKEIEDEDTYK